MRFFAFYFVAMMMAPAVPQPAPVVRGQTSAEVRAKLGPAPRVSRQVLFGRHIDQLAYDDPRPMWIELNCVRGEESYVCSILQLPMAGSESK